MGAARRPLLAHACGALLRAAGWKAELLAPVPPKAVLMFYPHTSNWDFVIGLLARFALAVPCSWAGKDTLFRWPFGRLFRLWGGLPVNRRERTGLVGQMVRAFDGAQGLLLVIAPEGTRKRTEGLRSGFYRLALAARVPLGLAFIDYRARRVGVGAFIELTGDSARDLATLRAFYAGCVGRRPDLQSPIALRPSRPRAEAG
jgi:1-acyl-sn-glycerol-3-phosphate acyltransferase